MYTAFFAKTVWFIRSYGTICHLTRDVEHVGKGTSREKFARDPRPFTARKYSIYKYFRQYCMEYSSI